jgi:hypothetical protein
MEAERKPAVGRRHFLRVLGASAGVAATAPLPTEAKADTETTTDKTKARYKETDHVKAFYAVNRYPKK